MNVQKFKNYLNTLSLDKLESLSLILPKDPTILSIYNNIYNQKFEQKREEYEGMNEYDDITKRLNFNITEEELKELNKIIGSDKMSKEELKNYFNKYNIHELESIKTIISYVVEDMPYEVEILDEVYKEKWENCTQEFSVPVKSYNYSLLNIVDKNKELEDKEIKFLYDLVENASLYLSSIQTYYEGYKNEIEDFNIDEYPILKIFELETILYNEIQKRKQKIKTL